LTSDFPDEVEPAFLFKDNVDDGGVRLQLVDRVQGGVDIFRFAAEGQVVCA